MLSAQIGKELLITENDHTELDIVASYWEMEMALSTPLPITPKPLKTVKQDTRLDTSVPVCRVADIKAENVNFLQQQGYSLSMQVPIGKKRSESFMVKKKGVEGEDHVFLVWNVVEHLKQYTDKIETYETVKPDIVFEANGQKWAVEVETGVNAAKYDHRRMKEKVALLEKEYGKHYFFVVGESHYLYFYEEYGKASTRTGLLHTLSKMFAS